MAINNIYRAYITVRRSEPLKLELAWAVCANVVIMVINIIVGLILARSLDYGDYGRLSYFINTFGALRLLASLGMTSQITYELSCARGHTKSIEDRFYPLLIIRLGSLLGLNIIVIGLAYLRGDQTFIIAAIASALALMHDFGVGALQGLRVTKKAIFILVLQPFLYAVTANVAVFIKLPVYVIYISFLASFAPTTILMVIWLKNISKFPNLIVVKLRETMASLRFAGGMYSLAIAGTLFTSFATLYFSGIGRYEDTAFITIPLNLVFMTAAVVSTAMNTVYFPRISEAHFSGDNLNAQALFHLFYGIVSAGAVIISTVLFLYPHTILGLLYGARYQGSSQLLVLIAPTAYFYSLQTVVTITIVAQGRVRSAVSGAFVSMILLVVLISITANVQNALLWAAGAHSITAAVGFVWQFRVLRYRVQNCIIQTVKQLIFALTSVGLGRLIVNDSPDHVLPAVGLLGVLTTLYIVWVWRGYTINA